MMKIVLLLLSIVVFTNCEHRKTAQASPLASELPEELVHVLTAHGGLENWSKMTKLTYTFQRGDRKEVHLIDLHNRKVLLKSDTWTIGFDGADVWVSPDKETYGGGSARFYHNLIFYFYAMPFVLADPGINYETLPPITIRNKEYRRIKISYNADIGDAPEDEYIICYDSITHRMEWLYYTVTYFSQEKSKQYNALHYETWQDVDGLLLPKNMSGYKTMGDSITELRYSNQFTEIVLEKGSVDQSIFDKPEHAEIDVE